jgi:hypothetical protein
MDDACPTFGHCTLPEHPKPAVFKLMRQRDWVNHCPQIVSSAGFGGVFGCLFVFLYFRFMPVCLQHRRLYSVAPPNS